MKKLLFAYDLIQNDNEYVGRLVEITKSIQELKVYVSLKEFWRPTQRYDYIIINWPDYLFNWRIDINQKDILNLENIFEYYKSLGTKIVTILHDEYAHSDRTNFSKKIFDICYQKCNTIAHLGKYSYLKYKSNSSYSQPKHKIIYHPLFKDFNFSINKYEARKILKISDKDFYIIVPGGIRHDYEYDYVLNIYNKIKIKNKKIHFLRSTAIKKPLKGCNKEFLTYKLNEYLEYKFKGIKHSYKFMPSLKLSEYFIASDLVILPRVDILNSGNITLSTQFNRLVLGAEIGNIKEWLKIFNHMGIDKNNITELDDNYFTEMIMNKINNFNSKNDIYNYCSDQVIKTQLINILGLV